MLLSDYLGIGYTLDENGIFDPILNKDSHFFINLQRLKKTTVPEFIDSYKNIQNFFRKIIKLLDKAQNKSKADTFYKQALQMFDFSEVNGICLGYAEGSTGTGFSGELASQVMSTAYDIVKAGIDDPEFFELLPLFQEKVGADRLSDMIATLILDDIKTYTKRINHELGINHTQYKDIAFNKDFLVNPYKNDDLLLVPVDILHKLPVADSWEDIDLVVSQNNALRAEINAEVAFEWNRYTTSERKSYLRQEVFKEPEACKRVLAEYRTEELNTFNTHDNFDYFLMKLSQKIENLDINWITKQKAITSHAGAMDILNFFKHWVEYNKGWEVIQTANSKNREKILQRVIHLSGLSYIKANNLAMSCEPDEGRGPVDFKISLGQDSTIIEVKLTSNNQYLHGYETQIEEYGKAEQTENMIYVLVDLGNPGKVKKVQNLHDRKYDEGLNPPDLIVIDSTEKESASRA